MSTSTSTPQNPLKAIRRVVTTHDEQGQAKVWMDEEVDNKSPPGFSDGVSFGLAWVTDSSPADCQTVSRCFWPRQQHETLMLVDWHRLLMARTCRLAS